MESDRPRTISIVNRTGRTIPTAQLKRAIVTSLSQQGARSGEVSLLITSDEEVRELNREFRNLDEATDVLTFPSDDPMVLGDIAISLPYAERQAEARKVAPNEELAFLAIHGALHLCGLDDGTDEDRFEMISEMNRAAVACGMKPDTEWASLLHGAVK